MRRRKTLSGKLVQAITERIEAGLYEVGGRLPSEQNLIEEFGVSRTVVREAVANLRANGLVRTVQGSGAFVQRPETPGSFRIEETSDLPAAQELLRILELRLAVESEAVALAARRRTESQLERMDEFVKVLRDTLESPEHTPEIGEKAAIADISFHRCIAEATGNVHFLRLSNYLSEYMLSRNRMKSLKFGGGSMESYLARTLAEHEMIFRAIRGGDAETARAALRVHLSGSRDRLQHRIDDISPY